MELKVIRPNVLHLRVIGRRACRVLLVEGDHALSEMYRLGLVLGGYTVDIACDGEAGLDRVLTGELPDIIIVDLGLPRVERDRPRKDALDMLSILQSIQLTNAVPVIALSSSADCFDDALDRGAAVCMASWQTTPRDLTRKVAQLLSETTAS